MPIPSYLKNILGNTNFITGQPVDNGSSFTNPVYQLPNNGGAINNGSIVPQSLYDVLQTAPTTPPKPVAMNPNVGGQQAMTQASGPFNGVPSTTPTPTSVPTSDSTSQTASSTSTQSPVSKTIQDITSSNESGLPLASIGMEGGYQGDMPSSEALRIEMMKDRAQGTGLYSVPKGQYASYDQIMGIRAMADKHYSNLINTASEAEKNAVDMVKTKSENAPLADYSSDPWMQGLVVNGLVQGGTANERAAHEAMLSKLPDEQKQELIKSSLYNSMSTGEKATFDTGDNLGAGVKQIIADQPADFSTNPYKYAGQKYSVYLGGTQDPKYLNFKSMVGNLTAPIINQIYGAAVTNSELTRAQEFIPDLASDSTAMAMTKLQHLAGFYDYANAKKLARKAGVPMTQTMDDYIAKYDPSMSKSGDVTMKRDDGKTTSFVFENGKWVNK
jgi:hypothetical protein